MSQSNKPPSDRSSSEISHHRESRASLVKNALSAEPPQRTEAQIALDTLKDALAPVLSIESPLERAMELVGDKYSFLIIHSLQQFHPLRFVELEEQIQGISPRTLSARLKHLHKHGLIERFQYPTIPPRVEYQLTDKGYALASTLSELILWVNANFPYRPAKASGASLPAEPS